MNQQLTPEQQAAMYQRQLAAQQNPMAQNPQMQAQMRQVYMQQQQRMAMQGGFNQNQHLQPQFQQQRRPSPMGQTPQGQAQMGHPGQQNPMVGFGGMPPPSSGPMGVTMQPGMHPQQQPQPQYQQQAYQQQMMRNNNAQFPVGMNPQMASVSPHPQGTPSRPPSQMQGQMPGTPVNMGGPGTPTMPQGNIMNSMHPAQPTPQTAPNAEQMAQPQKSPMGPPSQNGSVTDDKNNQRIETLLEINTILIKLALELQSQGKSHSSNDMQSPTTGGPKDGQNGTQSPSQPNAGPPKATAAMAAVSRPLQANIAYLTGSNQGKRPKWPFIMDLPPGWPQGHQIPPETSKQMTELYAHLRSLFPEYDPNLDPMTGQARGMQGQMRPPQQQPQQHQARPSMDNQSNPGAAGP